jgi:hypothetical protein
VQSELCVSLCHSRQACAEQLLGLVYFIDATNVLLAHGFVKNMMKELC